MNQALVQFLNGLNSESGVAIGLVITPPGGGTVHAIRKHFDGQPVMLGFAATSQEDLANLTARHVMRMKVDKHDTLVIDLECTNGTWLQASPFDYMLRSMLENDPALNLTIKRVVLISYQKGFKLSPATMERVQTHVVEA